MLKRCASIVLKSLAVAVVTASLTAPAHATEAAPSAAPVGALTLERIHADPPLAGRQPRLAKLSPGGRFVSTLEPSAADSEVFELWVRRIADGHARRLVGASDLIGNRTAVVSEAEKMALERRRVRGGGLTSYEWCGERDERIVVPLSGDLYLVELDGENVHTRRLTFDENEPERDARCDAAGRQIAFVKQNDLWVMTLDPLREIEPIVTRRSLPGPSTVANTPLPDVKRLTTTGTDGLSTGLAEFIAAEELYRYDGYWWSRDGKRLLAFEADERKVPSKTRAQIRADGTDLITQHYPAAGETNAVVVPLVIDVASGRVQRLDLPPATEYLPRAGWFADGTPWIETLNRTQTELRLVEYPNAQAAPREVFVESDAATWVSIDASPNLFEFPTRPLSGKPSIVWVSERSGSRQLWLLDRVTGSLAPLTTLVEPVRDVVCIGGGRIVFTAEQQRGRATELFMLGANDEVTRIAGSSTTGLPLTRSAIADRLCSRLLTSESTWGVPPTREVLTLGGNARPVAINGDAPDPLLAKVVPKIQPIDLLAADGKTVLNAFYMAPSKPSANPHGSATIVEVYGGPGAVTVQYAWSGAALHDAYWQSLGFGVLRVDTRGAHYRGRDYAHAHYRAFGAVEVDDLFAAARQLPKVVSGVDPARIGVVGGSYGGYLAARAVLDADTPFAAAVAASSVVDWTLYDTAYTERYLGMPEGGKAAPYAASNLASRAKLLARPLMLMHGTADDNVLFEHSLRLILALEREGKLFETVVYPGQAHGVNGRALQLHVDRATADFFVRRLQP